MKHTKVIIVTLFCIGFVLGSASLTFGQGGAPPYAGLNYEKIALLKWYPANQSGANFKVGSGPGGVAFDGANIWVANEYSNSVTKLRASDGASWGRSTPPHPVPWPLTGPTSGWQITRVITRMAPNTVTKLRASDGATSGDVQRGSVPRGGGL